MPEQITPSGFAALEESRKRFVKFDPTFSVGNIATVGTIVVSVVLAVTTMRSDQAVQKAELDFLKSQFALEKNTNSESLRELKSDVKTLQATATETNLNLSLLKQAITSAGAKK